MKIVVIGLSITSSWGNGHATTYRALLKEMARRDHEIIFLERDVPYYAAHRDLPDPSFCKVHLYADNEALKKGYAPLIASADAVIVGSYVQGGVEVGNWVQQTAKGVKAFYDIDTPVTLAKLEKEDYEYLHPDQIAGYNLYLSFSGGPILTYLEQHYKSPAARALYCSVDPDHYYPENKMKNWEMGYLGTFSTDRQPTVTNLLIEPAKEMDKGLFVVAGPQYPQDIEWPENVERIEHLPPSRHRDFYNSQKFTLNVTRQDMIKAGYSPSVRLFEAAACGVPIISDEWEGLTSLFEEGKEILIARNSNDVLHFIQTITEAERKQIGENARIKVMEAHTAKARAGELENYIQAAGKRQANPVNEQLMPN
jgi:spore maturation protein CgeB